MLETSSEYNGGWERMEKIAARGDFMPSYSMKEKFWCSGADCVMG